VSRLKVGLVHRDQWHRWHRIDGQFAYEVPQFEVSHIPVDKHFALNLADYAQFDLLWWDEGKHRGGPHFAPPPGRDRPVPVAYYCLYPTINKSTYRDRVRRAREDADLVLLEHDDLARWQGVGRPVARCAYSVDETRYHSLPGPRLYDVGFYCVWGYSPERVALDAWLGDFCARKGWRYGTTAGQFVEHYPQLLAQTKVVVHLNRTPATRPPRIFDASACGAAVLASRMPEVTGEAWQPDVHYAAFDEPEAYYHAERWPRVVPYSDAACSELAAWLERLIDGDEWAAMAQRAQRYVLQRHTWRVRAAELRQTFQGVLGI
jgi:hypothetical protein